MNDTPSSRPTLVRGLGLFMTIAVVVGTVIGSGVFKKPQKVATELPSLEWVAVVWIGVGVLARLGSLALAEIATLYPRAGGNYVFLREGYGRWAGFLWGWVEFGIIRTASIAALAAIFTESVHDILRYARDVDHSHNVLSFWELQGVTVAVITLLAIVNARGTILGGGLQVVVTSV